MIAERFMHEGEQKGKLEGELEGKLEAKREIARNMLREGLDVALIVKVTGLSQEEVEHLFEEVQAESK